MILKNYLYQKIQGQNWTCFWLCIWVWKHWSGSELTVKMHLEEISKNPTVTIPKFSTDHNAFFDHVAAHFVNLDMGFDVSYLVEDQMWQVVIKNKNESFTGKDFELPHAGSLAAISALRKI